MFTPLDPPIPLQVLDGGDGTAIGVFDYGQGHNLISVTAIDVTGEVWFAPIPKVRMPRNRAMGRMQHAAEEPCADYAPIIEAKRRLTA